MCVLSQGFDVAVNESALTGESMLIKKTPASDPFLLAGTQVMEGGGTMVVTAVGENSQQGIILMLLVDQDKEEGKSRSIHFLLLPAYYTITHTYTFFTCRSNAALPLMIKHKRATVQYLSHVLVLKIDIMCIMQQVVHTKYTFNNQNATNRFSDECLAKNEVSDKQTQRPKPQRKH